MSEHPRFLLNAVKVEIARLENLLDDYEAALTQNTSDESPSDQAPQLTENEYEALDTQLGIAIRTKRQLNGIDALNKIQKLGLPLEQIQGVTRQINESVATLANVEKYLGLVTALLNVAQGVVLSDSSTVASGVAKAVELFKQ
jgi:hypothetical protein